MKASVLPILVVLALGAMPIAAHAAPTPAPMYVNPGVDDTVFDGFSSDPKGAIHAAREYVAAGDMEGAIRHLAVYVATHPGEVGPRRFLGDLYYRTGQVSRAELVYEEILMFAPGDKETHNRLGTVYAQLNRVDDAIAQFDAALPGTDSVDDLVALHVRKGDLAVYLTQVTRLAGNFPTDPAIQGELGQVYFALGQSAAAQRYYDRALDLDSSNLTALNGLGLVYMRLHAYDAAIATFKRCLAITPAYQCENNMAASYLEKRDTLNAQRALDVARAIAPERAETFVNYGYLADLEGDSRGAVAQYARAMEIDPYLRDAYIDLALAYEKQKLYPLAQAVLLKGIASVRDDGRLHVLLGEAYLAQNDKRDAIEQFVLGSQGSNEDAASIAIERVKMLRNAVATSPPAS